MIKTMTAETVHFAIAKKLKDGSSYIDAICEFASENDMEIETLAAVIKKAYRQRVKHHPATRTFQALRIEVNQELRLVEELLPLLPLLLKKGGRVAIISFHSLEDRLVKRYFKEQVNAGYEAELAPITKKPLDGATYDVHNPRSRSAKLRAAVKT